MSKIILILSTLVFFTACAERGYVITTNSEIQTVTAQSITSLNKKTAKSENVLFKKMTQAVKKEQRKKTTTLPIETQDYQKQTNKPKKSIQNREKIKNTTDKKVITSKEKIKEVKPQQEVSKRVVYSDEENKLREQARKSQERREARLREIEKIRKEALIKRKRSNNKNNRSSQIIQDKKYPNINNTKNEIIANEKEARILAKRNLEETIRREALAKKEKERREALAEKEKERTKDLHLNKPKAFTKPLVFKQIDKIYHKFGTSEVHGHVIYLAQNTQETRLSNTKIYILPVSAKVNNWFKNYYLKNKNDGKSVTVNYLNRTTLNLERNFEFFGVPEGNYYIIIESDDPKSNHKIYISKKIQVGKYKKVMGVFSKKL